MRLPEQKIETITVRVGGYDLVFRKLALKDAIELTKDDANDAEKVAKLLANLLEGYENSYEEKLEFIKNLQLDSTDELNNLLTKLGFLSDKKK